MEAEWRESGQEQQAEKRPDNAHLDRMPALGCPVDVAEMDGERELVEHERRTDAEPDRQHVDTDVTRLERDLEHPADQCENAPQNHVMHVHVAEVAAAPVANTRKAGVEPSECKGEE